MVRRDKIPYTDKELSDDEQGNAEKQRAKWPKQQHGKPYFSPKTKAPGSRPNTIPSYRVCASLLGGIVQQTFICHAEHVR